MPTPRPTPRWPVTRPVHIGGSAPGELPLADRILGGCATGAEAMHRATASSANDDFAERCEAAGIAFIGPRPHAIRAMGQDPSPRP